MIKQFYRWLIEIIFICLMFSDLFGVSELRYFDEIIGILFFFLIIIDFIKKKGNIKNKQTKNILICMIGIACIGLAGNLINPIQQNIMIATIGMFITLKQYIYGLYMLLCLNKIYDYKLYSFFLKVSKIMLSMLLFCTCINSIVNIGMSGPSGEFCFFSQFGGTVACWTILFLSFCYSDSKSNRLFWFLVSVIIILFSKSGLGILGICLIVMLYYFYEKAKKFRWYYLVPITIIGVLISWNEISNYLLNANAPRAKLFIYSVVTAAKYFPIGSGFSTYASSMAVTYYSKLYYIYGFDTQFGMTNSNAYFLMDSYYPMIFGELGFLGTIIFGLMIFQYLKLIFSIPNKLMKNSALYLFVFLLIAGLGFGTGSSWGCAIYILIPIIIKKGIQN